MDPKELEAEEADQEACPGCGCKPGEGITPGCHHPDGCGYWEAVLEEEEENDDGEE